MNSLIFNDASLPFLSNEDCLNNIDTFFEIIFYINEKNVNFNKVDEKLGGWNSYIYAEGFECGKWLNQIDDIESSRLIKSVVANVPCPLIVNNNPIEDIIFSLKSDQDIEVTALGVASILNSYCVSFASSIHWKSNSIDVLKHWDDDGEIKIESTTVDNIFSLEQIDIFLHKIIETKKSNKDYLKTLDIKDNKEYPNIIFCTSALKNLTAISITTIDFKNIIYALDQLDLAIKQSNCLEDLIENSELNMSFESVETMKCAKHARKRWFKHPFLGDSLFELHVKNFQNGKRMHIFADYHSKTVSIGYFGLHLSTVKY